MKKLAIIEEIKRHDDLLSLPQALSEILREIDKPDFGPDKLVRIVLKDPALTSRILKMANSSFYHRFSDISTVNQAVQVLGMTTVKCLALSTTVFNLAKLDASTGMDTRRFFSYILSVASAAKRQAQMLSFRAAEEVFVAGLLHEIGTLFFLHHYPKEYRAVLSRCAGNSNLLEVETEVLGIDHCQVGYHLARRWRLPEHICDAIGNHHSVADPVAEVSIKNILRLACLLNQDGNEVRAYDLESRLMQINRLATVLSLSPAQINEVSSSLLSWTVAAASYLDIDIGSTEEILSRANGELWNAYSMLENLFKERQELSHKLLTEEHARGAIESKNIAIATLSHYVNNAIMAIYGRSQILRQAYQTDDTAKLKSSLPVSLDVIDKSIRKIVAVLEEIKEISPIDDIAFYEMSKAMKIDDRIERRMAQLGNESGLVLPEEAIDQS
jgi:HD-like signal output (HDOD) protein